MHTLLDLRGSIPMFIRVTTGDTHDVNILDQILFQPGAYYVVDRGYLDYCRLHSIHLAGAFSVTRAKSNLDACRIYSRPADKQAGILADQSVALNGYLSRKDYPSHLRRIRFRDGETGKNLVFLSNNFTLPALTIAQIYKQRWQVELFFKWIKQHLHIKAFYVTGESALKTQLWIAISVHLLVGIVKKRLDLPGSLYTLLQVLSVTLFEKTPISQVLQKKDYTDPQVTHSNQLILFEF
jgi:IS4 transposase